MKNAIIPLNIQIEKNDQITLINAVKENANLAEVEENKIPPFWYSKGIRHINNIKLPELNNYERGRLDYLLRLHENVCWSWRQSPLTPIIQKILEPLELAIIKLNRISLIIQIPGKAVPAHRDLIVGDIYDNMESSYSTFQGQKKLQYLGDHWFVNKVNLKSINQLHKKQSYLGLRIPLSEYPGNNGKPFVQDQYEDKHYYNVSSNLFLLDEATNMHGADPVYFHRGVIIVDCELNLKECERFYKL